MTSHPLMGVFPRSLKCLDSPTGLSVVSFLGSNSLVSGCLDSLTGLLLGSLTGLLAVAMVASWAPLAVHSLPRSLESPAQLHPAQASFQVGAVLCTNGLRWPHDGF